MFCDPESQPMPASVKSLNVSSILQSSNTSFSGSIKQKSSRRAPTPAPQLAVDGQSRRTRPLSWLSIPRRRGSHQPLADLETTIAQQGSMASLAPSSISSPVLNSTTNVKVAESESVRCSELLLNDQLDKDKTQQSSIDINDTQRGDKYSFWAATIKSVKRRIGHTRRASMSGLFERSWPSHGTSKWRMHGSRNHAEKAMSEHEFQIQTDNTANSRKGVNQLPQRSQSAFSLRPPKLPRLVSDNRPGNFVASLSKSFASAVDKIDLHSSPTLVEETETSGIQKTKSHFSLRQVAKEGLARSSAKGMAAARCLIVTDFPDHHETQVVADRNVVRKRRGQRRKSVQA